MAQPSVFKAYSDIWVLRSIGFPKQENLTNTAICKTEISYKNSSIYICI